MRRSFFELERRVTDSVIEILSYPIAGWLLLRSAVELYRSTRHYVRNAK